MVGCVRSTVTEPVSCVRLRNVPPFEAMSSKRIATPTIPADVVAGAASVSIDFEDMASNAGTTVTSTTDSSAVVIDLVAPTLSTVTIVSSNANDETLANGGDTITLELAADEDILPPTVRLVGEVASVSGDGSSYTATYTVDAADLVSVDGSAASILVTFSDLAGNEGVAVDAVTDDSAVTLDLTAPTLSSVTIASDNSADASRANAGDTITLSIVASEDIMSPTVTIAGSSASVTSTSASVYSATYSVTSSDDDGRASLSVGFQDVAGNAGLTLTSVTDLSRVTIDLTAPTLSTVHIESNNAAATARANGGDTIVVSFTSNENIVEPTVNIAGQPATVTGSDARTWSASYVVVGADVDDGSASISIAFADLASNAGVTVTSVTDGSAVTLDLTAPTLATVSIISDNAGEHTSVANHGDEITVSLTADEDITGVTVSIAGQSAAVTGSELTYSATYTVAEADVVAGAASVSIDFEDMASNAGTTVTSTTDSSA
eukprot:SAG22_NODE_3080_length_1957_cov_1.169537_2_plen_492_part_01